MHVFFIILLSIILLSINVHMLSGNVIFNPERVAGIKLCVSLDVPAEAEHLRFLISVQNLTAEGIKPICEAEVWPEGGLPPRAIFNFRVWNEHIWITEFVEGKIVWKKSFKPHNIWVYAIASDRPSKRFYYGSWSGGIDPHHNQTAEVTIKVKAYNSSEVPASGVPAPDQIKSWKVVECKEAIILAVNLPEGAYLDYAIKAGANVKIDSYEKFYWTFIEYASDPNAIWYEEGWNKYGTTSIILDAGSGIIGDGLYIVGPFSHYFYPTNVDFIMATTDKIYEGFYYVFVKVYAVDGSLNGAAEEQWSPPSDGMYINNILRPNPGPLTFPIQTVYSLQSISVSFTFNVIVGGTTSVGFSGGITFTFEKINVVEAYIYVDWSKAPSYANKLKIYAFDTAASRLKAIFA